MAKLAISLAICFFCYVTLLSAAKVAKVPKLTAPAKKITKRSIDLSAAHSIISDSRLPGEIIPNNYTLDLRPNLADSLFSGKVKIVLTWQEPTNKISLHASHDLEIVDSDVKLMQIGFDDT